MKKIFLPILLIVAVGGYLAYKYDKLPWDEKADSSKGRTQPAAGGSGTVNPVPRPERSQGDTLFAAKKYSEALNAFLTERTALLEQASDGRSKRLQHVQEKIGECYIQEGEKLASEKKLYEARSVLSKALRSVLPEEKLDEIRARIVKLNESLIYSPLDTPDSVSHTVVAGDMLKDIARKFGVTYESIMRVNRMTKDNIRIGQVLKILQGTYTIEVSLSRKRLSFWLDDKFMNEFPVGIGKPETPTPVGTYTLNTREKEPVWWSPDGKQYEFGHPLNILGTRWLGFTELPNYGIHGTTQPETVDKESSNGCIRLHNKSVEELFDFVPLKTKVVISE